MESKESCTGVLDLHAPTVSVSQLNQHVTSWFDVKTSLRRGDNLSTTLFALFINDMAEELKSKAVEYLLQMGLNCVVYFMWMIL